MTRHLATLRESRSVSTLMPLKIIATQRNRTCTSVSLQASGPIRTCRARHQLDDEAFGYLKRVEVRFDPNAFENHRNATQPYLHVGIATSLRTYSHVSFASPIR